MSGGRIWQAADFREATREEPGTHFRCALCGAQFTHGERVCDACAMAVGCDLVRCPSCGYQFPRRSALLDGLRRAWAALRRRA